MQLSNNGRRHVGNNGEAAPRVCVPANEVSVLIGLLCEFSDLILKVLGYLFFEKSDCLFD
ncbi:hypothetical protein EJ103_08060 [Pseudoalteromonas sp. Xi13]|nr:hypothetical protein EJ103_08060 [Pseudoalteromonas sp. Xi13]